MDTINRIEQFMRELNRVGDYDRQKAIKLEIMMAESIAQKNRYEDSPKQYNMANTYIDFLNICKTSDTDLRSCLSTIRNAFTLGGTK